MVRSCYPVSVSVNSLCDSVRPSWMRMHGDSYLDGRLGFVCLSPCCNVIIAVEIPSCAHIIIYRVYMSSIFDVSANDRMKCGSCRVSN